MECATLLGPGQSKFVDFREACVFYYKRYVCDVENDTRKSRVIPPAFPFKHSEVADVDVKQKSEISKDRKADSLQRLADTGVDTDEFIAIRGFTIDDRKQKYLRLLFGEQYIALQQKLRDELGLRNFECDYIVVHNRVGIVFIEVKGGKSFGTAYTQLCGRHRFIVGLYNIVFNNPEVVSSFLHVIVTVGNEATSTASWSAQSDSYVHHIVAENENTLAESFSKLFSESKRTTVSMPHEQFENLVSLILGVFALAPGPEKGVVMPADVVSRAHAAVVTGLAVADQDFATDNTKPSRKATSAQNNHLGVRAESSLVPCRSVSEVVYRTLPLVLLSPDQKNVLQGMPKQYIFGAAGTGKTLIMMAKIMELASQPDGKLITVVASPANLAQYASLMSRNGFENFKLLDLQDFVLEVYVDLDEQLPNVVGKLWDDTKQNESSFNSAEALAASTKDTLLKVLNTVKQPNVQTVLAVIMRKWGHLFMDDAFTSVIDFRDIAFGIAAAISSDDGAGSYAWITYDTSQVSCMTPRKLMEDSMMALALDQGLMGNQSATTLSTVMRYTETMFAELYGANFIRGVKLKQQQTYQPILGHKRQGVAPSFISLPRVLETSANPNEIAQVLTNVVSNLTVLNPCGIPFSFVAVIFVRRFTYEYLAQTIKENDCMRVTAEMFELAGIPHRLLSDDISKQVVSVNSDRVAIGFDNEAASCEWPVVIVVTFSGQSERTSHLAKSRCTTWLIKCQPPQLQEAATSIATSTE